MKQATGSGLRVAGAILAGIALALGLFALAGWVGSSLPRNPDWREPARGVTIMVESNGFHTGIVMPLVTPHKDWRATFPEAAKAHGGKTTHIAVGWGEREVFLDVETWLDLRPATVLRILTTGSQSVMRVSHYVRPAPGPHHRPLVLTAAQYARLARLVEAKLAPPGPDGRRQVLRGSYSDDAYYEARDRYTMRRTCNSWVGDVLAAAGVRMGWWTPFAGGVMKWIEMPEAGSAG